MFNIKISPTSDYWQLCSQQPKHIRISKNFAEKLLVKLFERGPASGFQTRRLGSPAPQLISILSQIEVFFRARSLPIMPPSWMPPSTESQAAAKARTHPANLASAPCASSDSQDPSAHLDLRDARPRDIWSNPQSLSRIQAIKISTSKTANAYTGLP